MARGALARLQCSGVLISFLTATAVAQPPTVPQPEREDADEPLPQCHTDIRLSGTVYDPDHAEHSFALLHVQANRPGEVYREGENVSAFEILSVDPRGVLLRGEHGECWLGLSGARASAPPPPRKPPAPARPHRDKRSKAAFSKQELDEAIQSVGPQRYTIKRNLLPNVVARAGAIMSATHYEQVKHYSHVAGVRLTEFPQDGLLARLGLQRGDMVKTLNGLEVDSVDGALKAQQLLTSASRISLLVQRAGTPVSLDYEIVP